MSASWAKVRSSGSTQFMRDAKKLIAAHKRKIPVSAMVGHPWHYRGTIDKIAGNLKGLLLDQKWSDLLEQSELVMATPQGRGWLDLQRYVLTACVNLGGGYDRVASSLHAELRSLLVQADLLLNKFFFLSMQFFNLVHHDAVSLRA